MKQSPTVTIHQPATRIAPAGRAGIQSSIAQVTGYMDARKHACHSIVANCIRLLPGARILCDSTAVDAVENESNRASIQITGGCVVASMATVAAIEVPPEINASYRAATFRSGPERISEPTLRTTLVRTHRIIPTPLPVPILRLKQFAIRWRVW
jgi:hypothetical protein